MFIIIKYMDVIYAITARLENNFPDIPIMLDGDIQEDIPRPSFLISIGNIKSTDFCNECKDSRFKIRIHYFPKDKKVNKVEILDVTDTLDDTFFNNNVLAVNQEFNIEIYEEIETETVGKVLHYYIPIFISQDYNTQDNIPQIEELDYNANIK